MHFSSASLQCLATFSHFLSIYFIRFKESLARRERHNQMAKLKHFAPMRCILDAGMSLILKGHWVGRLQESRTLSGPRFIKLKVTPDGIHHSEESRPMQLSLISCSSENCPVFTHACKEGNMCSADGHKGLPEAAPSRETE